MRASEQFVKVLAINVEIKSSKIAMETEVLCFHRVSARPALALVETSSWTNRSKEARKIAIQAFRARYARVKDCQASVSCKKKTILDSSCDVDSDGPSTILCFRTVSMSMLRFNSPALALSHAQGYACRTFE